MARERLGLPVSKLRERRRRAARILWVAAAAGVLILAGGVTALFHLPAIQIREVAVAGLEPAVAEEVRAAVERELSGSYLYLFPKRNIFIYPKRAVLSMLDAAFPKLHSVEVGFKRFDAIEVQAQLRNPAALWCGVRQEEEAAAECFFVDEDGFVYAQAPQFGGVVFVRYFGEISGGTPPGVSYLAQGEYRALSALVSALGRDLQASPEVVEVEGQDVTVRFSEGYALYFGRRDEHAAVLARLALALSSDPLANADREMLSYIDLRFGNRVFYKFKE